MIDFDATIGALRESVFAGPAVLERELRKAIAERAASPPGQGPELPGRLGEYIHKLAHEAYKITQEDLEALHADGYDEHAIYELSVAAAFSAGLERFDRGMSALRGEVS